MTTRIQAAAEANRVLEDYAHLPGSKSCGNLRAMKVLDAIHKWDKPYGMSVREVMRAAGLPNPSMANYWLRYWHEKGRVTWDEEDSGRMRFGTIRLVRDE